MWSEISSLPLKAQISPGFWSGVNLNEALCVSASVLSVEMQWMPWISSPVLCFSDKYEMILQ